MLYWHDSTDSSFIIGTKLNRKHIFVKPDVCENVQRYVINHSKIKKKSGRRTEKERKNAYAA